jgi:hypothetical protein
MPTPSAAAAAVVADLAEIRRALDVLHPNLSDIIEIRALEVRHPHFTTTTSGYFDDRDKAAAAAALLTPFSAGVYPNLHRIHAGLLTRADNRLRHRHENPAATTDHDTLRRLWLPIDLDTARPAGISSNEAEHALAIERAYALRDHLTTEGWDAPVVIDSGNGAHLLYAIDQEPADGFTHEFLNRLATEFSDERIHIDERNHNAGRIWKLPGTGRGRATQCRASAVYIAWRACWTCRMPVSAQHPQSSKQWLDAFIQRHTDQLNVVRIEAWNGGERYILQVCPFDNSHANSGTAAILITKKGAFVFNCQHNSCAANDWKALRALVGEPTRYAAPAANERGCWTRCKCERGAVQAY